MMNMKTLKLSNKQDKLFFTKLDHLMRVFCSSKRFAFNRLLEGMKRDDVIKLLQVKFDLNKRFAEDAVLQAQATITSQRELLPMRIEDLEAKIHKTELKLSDYVSGKRKPKKTDIETVLKGLNARLSKLKSDLSELLEHQAKGTIPKVIFSGRKNFFDRMKGKISKEEWKDLRSNEVYSRGDKTKGGNLNLRLSYEEGRFFLEAKYPFGTKKGGHSEIIRGEVMVSDKHFAHVIKAILPDMGYKDKKVIDLYSSYTVQIKREGKDYYVHLITEEEVPGKEIKSFESFKSHDIIAGIDVNIDRIAVSILTKQGNFVKSKVFYCHEMEYVSSNRRSNIAGETAKEVIDWLLSENVGAVVLEDIKLKQQHDTNKRFNRLVSSFAKNKLIGALTVRALRNGFVIKKVNPAYTSVIGRFKYMKKYGISVHEAASYAIGRRGLLLDEKLPVEMIRALKEKVKPHLIKTLGSMEETEKKSLAGKQRRKKCGMFLKTIDTFKHQKSWKMWNVVHKTLWLKNHELQLKTI